MYVAFRLCFILIEFLASTKRSVYFKSRRFLAESLHVLVTFLIMLIFGQLSCTSN